MGSVSATSDDGMLEIGGEDGKLGQGRGEDPLPNFVNNQTLSSVHFEEMLRSLGLNTNMSITNRRRTSNKIRHEWLSRYDPRCRPFESWCL